MQQKTTYAIYLLIGISLLTACLSSCQKEISHRLDAEFIFENHSNKTLVFSVHDPTSSRNEIILEPNSSDTIKLIPSEGPKNPNPETCCQGLLNSVLAGSDQGSIVINYDTLQCIIESPANIDNYKNERVNERHFRYTFTFTDELLQGVSQCQ